MIMKKENSAGMFSIIILRLEMRLAFFLWILEIILYLGQITSQKWHTIDEKRVECKLAVGMILNFRNFMASVTLHELGFKIINRS